ncbi:MAG: hypothetical protein GY778_23590 [bacterium]|nr:hypothetical protein [bacterium]
MTSAVLNCPAIRQRHIISRRRAIGIWLPVAACLVSGAPSFGQTPCDQHKITAADAAAGDRFGDSVSVSGDLVVVGAHGDNHAGSLSGSAYVFARDAGGVDNWGQVAKLTAADAAVWDCFGQSVSVSGHVAVVGAWGENGFAGAAYVFAPDAGGVDNWGQVAKLTAADAAPADHFGYSVSLSGDLAVVGAQKNYHMGIHSGSAYVFVRNAGGVDNWGQVAKLNPDDVARDQFFGQSVSVSGDLVVVGAWGADSYRGSVYVFARYAGGPDNWGQVAKLTADDAAPVNYLGISVSISGDVIVAAADFRDDAGNAFGTVYVFARDADEVDNWHQVAKLTADDAEDEVFFGRSVSVSGDLIVAGAWGDDHAGHWSGSAYLFARNAGGVDNWGQVTKLTAADATAEDLFGASVSVSGDLGVVGAGRDDDAGTSSGSAYVFSVFSSLGLPSNCIANGLNGLLDIGGGADTDCNGNLVPDQRETNGSGDSRAGDAWSAGDRNAVRGSGVTPDQARDDRINR